MERAEWALRTLDVIPDSGMRALPNLGLDELSREMEFELEVLGPRLIAMKCTYRRTLPEPLRLGAASLAWRRIDEEVARLWTIGREPRFRYPEFMRQRRRMVERLDAPARQVWTWVCLYRAAPVLGALLGSVVPDPGATEAEEFEMSRTLAALTARLAVEPSEHASRDLELRDVGRLWVQAWEAALGGSRSGSADTLAYATERVADVFTVLDNAFEGTSLEGLAHAEDIAWFLDARELADRGDGARTQVLDRCRVGVHRSAEFCARPGVRAALRAVSGTSG
ncbi:hypothetical protein ACFYYI_39300 [Streptomyces sp. NPDC002387]|uniref:hypothetical protein n=2 Tax=unclassified Streptomyces TaxID=2593676 RepID=UPI00367CCC99